MLLILCVFFPIRKAKDCINSPDFKSSIFFSPDFPCRVIQNAREGPVVVVVKEASSDELKIPDDAKHLKTLMVVSARSLLPGYSTRIFASASKEELITLLPIQRNLLNFCI